MVVLCNPSALSQDLGVMEGVLMGQLLQVVPSIPGNSEQISEEDCLPILSILARISKEKKGWWHICLLNELRMYIKTLIISVSGHHIPSPPPPLYWLNLRMKKIEWIFTISQILHIYSPLYFLSATLFILAVHLHFCVLAVGMHFFLIFKQRSR